MVSKGQRKHGDILWLVLLLTAAVLLNVLANLRFVRLDLTEEKRHSLSPATIAKLEALPDVIYFRVYLAGDLPTEFAGLSQSIREKLDEFRAYAGTRIEYSFVDPAEGVADEELVKVYEELTRLGLQYTTVRIQRGDEWGEQVVFPGAIATYAGREVPLQLLKSRAGATELEMLEMSAQQIEYELISAVEKLTVVEKKVVAFVEGHSELDSLETADIERALREFYDVERITINGQLNALRGVDAIVVAQPDSAFSEKDKYVIDQFIMHGGKALWVVDPVLARMDSLRESNLTLGTVTPHNLDDQLFKYGARLNSNLVLDLEAAPLPIVTGMVGNQPRQEMFTWFYAPLVMGNEQHPVSRNLNRIICEFTSTIEPVEVAGVKATKLLSTSNKCRTVNAPARISFNILRERPSYDLFTTGPHTVALLLEGTFPSVFQNRLPKRLMENDTINFVEQSVPTRMIVVADGDIIRNPVNRTEGKYFALGYYKYTNSVYGNADFILNAMSHLCDENGLLAVRNKEIKTRLLNTPQIDEQRTYWQALNVAAPVALVLLAGALLWWRRRRLYRKF